MALSADTLLTFETPGYDDKPVKASTKIYKGAAVGDDGSGYMRGLVAGDPFRGFADAQADNSSGAAGDINVHLITKGLAKLTISGVVITDVGKKVYASADGTFTLTQGSNTEIGYVARYVTTDTAMVQFEEDHDTYTGGEAAASVADSKAVSNSVVESTNKSTSDSKATSLSTIASANLSTGDSKATSLSTLTSIADSKAVSNSVIASANLSTGDSKDASQSVVISTLDSKVASSHP